MSRSERSSSLSKNSQALAYAVLFRNWARWTWTSTFNCAFYKESTVSEEAVFFVCNSQDVRFFSGIGHPAILPDGSARTKKAEPEMGPAFCFIYWFYLYFLEEHVCYAIAWSAEALCRCWTVTIQYFVNCLDCFSRRHLCCSSSVSDYWELTWCI